MYTKISFNTIINDIFIGKNLPEKIIFDSIKSGIFNAVQQKFKILNVNVVLNSDNYFIFYAIFNVISNLNYNISIKNSFNSIPLQKAIEYDITTIVGFEIKKEIKNFSFNRIDIQKAKHIIKQSAIYIEKNYITTNLKSKVGGLITGRVRKFTSNLLIVDIDDNIEGIIRKRNLIKSDFFKPGDKVRAVFSKIIKSGSRVILQLDRTCDNMLRVLLIHEVPELKEGLIEIKDVARDPGMFSKVSLKTNNPKLNPVAACIGPMGLRIKSVSKELNGEKIELIIWDENIEFYIRNILKHINIYSLNIDQDNKSLIILVRKVDFLKLIGNNGYNIKLINKLINWNLTIKTR